MKKIRFAVLLTISSALSVACILISQRVQVQSVAPQNDVRIKSAVKAHLKDGSTVTFLSGVTISAGKVYGEGSLSDIALTPPKPVRAIALNDVIGMESFQTRTNKVKTITFSALATVGATVGGAILAVAIFGSCPTVYSDDGKTEEAELFSSSIAPLFEARDIDRLKAQPDAAGELRLEIRNEAMETHYINHLQLLEVSHDSDELVLPSISGDVVAVRDLRTPAAMTDKLGNDVRPFFNDIDGKAYSTDLRTIAAANVADMNDWIDFDVPVDPVQDSTTLVFRMRNSLLSTTLLYDVMLGPAGARAIDWLNTDLTNISTAVELGRWHQRRAGLHISVLREGEFQEVARVPDSGPISWHDIAASIPVVHGQRSVRVRLSFLADHWRIDYVRVAGSARRVEPKAIPISHVQGPDGRHNSEVRTALIDPDDQYLQTTPGQRLYVTFNVGPAVPTRPQTFLLSSQGYYTEWIRETWIESATANRAFVPTDESLLTALRKWTGKRDSFEKQFREARVPVGM